jgi:hypothetical protein
VPTDRSRPSILLLRTNMLQAAVLAAGYAAKILPAANKRPEGLSHVFVLEPCLGLGHVWLCGGWECLYVEEERLGLCKRPQRSMLFVSTDPHHIDDPVFEWFYACAWMLDDSGWSVAYETESPESWGELVDLGKQAYIDIRPGPVGGGGQVLMGRFVGSPSWLSGNLARHCLTVLTKRRRLRGCVTPFEHQQGASSPWLSDIVIRPHPWNTIECVEPSENQLFFLKPPTVMTGAMMEYHAMARLVNQRDLGLDRRSYPWPLPYGQIDDPDTQSNRDSGIDDGEASDLLSAASTGTAKIHLASSRVMANTPVWHGSVRYKPNKTQASQASSSKSTSPA